MEELKKIIEALGKAFEEFKAANNKRLAEIEAKGEADPLLIEQVEKINQEISALVAMKAQIEQLETRVARSALPGESDAHAEQTAARAAHREAFGTWFREGINADLRNLEVQAALSTQSDPSGGFTVPEELEAAIGRVAESVSAMRRLAATLTIGTDTYKTLVSQAGAVGGWVGEIATRAETTTPTMAQIEINTKEVYAMPKTTQLLLDDSVVDIEAWLAGEVGITFAEKEGTAFITGNGVEEPMGILSYTPVANASYTWGKIGYIASGATATFTDVDKLIDLQHALKSVYRNGAAWLMNDLTMAHIRKFKDGEGNYVWRPGLEAGAVDTLFGKPVEIDDNMPDIGAGAYPIAFANFARAYLIIDRMGIRVIRDVLTLKGQVLFYTTRRVGAGLILYESIKLLKVASS